MAIYRDWFGKWRVKAIKTPEGFQEINWIKIRSLGPVFSTKELKRDADGYLGYVVKCPICKKKVAETRYGNSAGKQYADMSTQLACEAHLIENPICLEKVKRII